MIGNVEFISILTRRYYNLYFKVKETVMSYYPYSSYSAYLDSRYGYPYSRYYDYPYYSRYYDSPYYSRYYDYPYYSRYSPYYYDPVTYTTTEYVGPYATPVRKTVVADTPVRALATYDPIYDSAYWRSRYLDYPSYRPYSYYSSYRYYSPYYRHYYW